MNLFRYFRLLSTGLALCLELAAQAATGGGSGTAAQYFTNQVVGNSRTYALTCTTTGHVGPGCSGNTTVMWTITASAGGVVTYQIVASDGYTETGTHQIDATGALINPAGLPTTPLA